MAFSRILLPFVLGLVSTLVSLLKIQVNYKKLQTDDARRNLDKLMLVSLPVVRTAPLHVKHLIRIDELAGDLVDFG